MVRPRLDTMFIVSTSGRSTVWATQALWMERSTASRFSGWPPLDDLEQLVDEPLDEGDVGAGTGDVELVAPHVDLDVGELALHGAEHLVTGPEERHHRDLGRDDHGVPADV